MFQNNVSKIYWSDAVLTTTYLINRLPSVVLDKKSPLEVVYQRKIIFNHLRIFGCTCYVHQNKRDKLDHTSIKAIFLGYSYQKKGYKCFDPINHKLYISRDVSFLENKPYFKEINNELDNHIAKNDFVIPISTNQIEEQEIVGNEEEEEEENKNEDNITKMQPRVLKKMKMAKKKCH